MFTNKSQDEGDIMWNCLDSFMAGGFAQGNQVTLRSAVSTTAPGPANHMETLLEELGRGFEQSNAFVRFLSSLVEPIDTESTLHDRLPFPETLGASSRMPGVEPYVDFVFGVVFSRSAKELSDPQQLRMVRLSCLEFALTCLETFNEDLILIGNETSVPVDSIIGASDLATYVRLHPFGRVMEWMLDGSVVQALFDTIHEDSTEMGKSAPDSPLILSVIRAVDVVLKVLNLQDTYLDVVRPIIWQHSGQRRLTTSNSSYTSFDEGIVQHLELVVDLGRCCGLGHPALTLGCLKLLETISTSQRIVTAWNPAPGRQSHRNKAIVVLEKDGAAEAVSASFIAEMITPLDLGLEADAPNYMIKIYILDFLFECLQASPNQPSIAHQLLGFHCDINALSAPAEAAFDSRTSLYHNIIKILLETPFGDAASMRRWLVMLKFKAMRVFHALWKSPLSATLVLNDLRENEFMFHLLLREITLQPALPWDGGVMGDPEFLGTNGSLGFVEFLSMRSMALEYYSVELCSVAQSRLPHLKRRIFDALSGRVVGELNELHATPTIFDMFDFLVIDITWNQAPPDFNFFKDLDLRSCLQQEPSLTLNYNIERVRQLILLKRGENRLSGQLVTREQEAEMHREEQDLVAYLILLNRYRLLEAKRLEVLKAWANLLLVMFESNEFDSAARVSFSLQAVQAILPSLETYGSENPNEAFELAKLAKVLIFKLDTSQKTNGELNGQFGGNLVSDKLSQLFQICLYAIGKWASNSELRATYYSICYRYVTGIVDKSQDFLPGRQKAIKSIQLRGEKLLSVITDDATGGDPLCQPSALILLGAMVSLSTHEDDALIVESLSNVNAFAILVDSLKTVMTDGLNIIQSGDKARQSSLDAKLALLLLLCQTRNGAKYILQANIFRVVEISGLFSTDPELQIGR
jgi:nuclear pore complex protein Nup205